MKIYKVNAHRVKPIQPMTRTFYLPGYCDVTIRVNASADYTVSAKSNYLTENTIKRSPSFKLNLQQISEEMIKEFEAQTKAFTEVYKRYRAGITKIETRSDFERRIENVPLEKPQPKTFFLSRPKRDDSLKLLHDEAQAVFHGKNATQSEITSYTQEHFDEVANDRMEKYNELRTLFYQIEQNRIEKEEKRLEREYQRKRKALLDILNGEPKAIEKGMAEIAKTIDIPFDIDFQYLYDQQSGKVSVEIEIINGIHIPLQKASMLSNNRFSVKNKLVREVAEETKDTILSFVYFFASKVFEISHNISKVELTLWAEEREKGHIWVEFPREGIMRDNPKYLVPAFDINSYPKVADIRVKTASTELVPIMASKFLKQIEEQRSNGGIIEKPSTLNVL